MENIHLLSQNLRLINYFYTRSLAKELSAMKVGYHFEVLLILARQEQPLTQNQLAELLHIDKSRVANIVSSLQEKKLVTVKTNPADRRQHHISLSPDSFQSIPRIERKIQQINEKVHMGISKEKLAVFIEVAEAMMQNLITKKP